LDGAGYRLIFDFRRHYVGCFSVTLSKAAVFIVFSFRLIAHDFPCVNYSDAVGLWLFDSAGDFSCAEKNQSAQRALVLRAHASD
jgi:hypothetical protein